MQNVGKRNFWTIDSNKAFTLLVSLLWGYQAFFRFFAIILNRIPFIGPFIFPAFIIIVILLSLQFIFRKIHLIDLGLSAIVIFVGLGTIALNLKTTIPFQSIAMEFFTQCFVMYYIGMSLHYKISIDAKFLKQLTRLSYVCVITLSVVSMYVGTSFDFDWKSNQYIPYWLLPHLLLILINIFEKFSFIEIGILMYGLTNLIIMGNRGSVVCFLAMLLILTIYKTSALKFRRRLLLLSVMSGIILLVWFTNLYELGLRALYNYALSHNMSTRVFQTFLGEYSAGVSFDSGRWDIQKTLINLIKVNPFGYGLGSDRYFTGMYAHNILLEIIMGFGIFFGGFINSVILINLIFAAKKIKKIGMLEWFFGYCFVLDSLSYLYQEVI